MIKFAIVGNIASGKSEMEAILDKENIVVLDTDIMFLNMENCLNLNYQN